LNLLHAGPRKQHQNQIKIERIHTMKLKLIPLIAAALFVSHSYAGDMKVEAAIAKDKDTRPATIFPADVPKLYAFFRTHGSEKGDKFRGVWIAEDVGGAAPRQTKIDEASLTADQDDFYGAFSLTKPTKGWPVGKYRVDIYAGDEVATSVKFTIKKSESANKESDESENDSSND
jgi:hypothetical protein